MTDFKNRLKALHQTARRNPVTRYPYKVLVIAVGALVFLAGVAMLVLPGPGIVGMGIGLLILSTELPWAERVLRRCTKFFRHRWENLKTWWQKKQGMKSRLAADD